MQSGPFPLVSVKGLETFAVVEAPKSEIAPATYPTYLAVGRYPSACSWGLHERFSRMRVPEAGSLYRTSRSRPGEGSG